MNGCCSIGMYDSVANRPIKATHVCSWIRHGFNKLINAIKCLWQKTYSPEKVKNSLSKLTVENFRHLSPQQLSSLKNLPFDPKKNIDDESNKDLKHLFVIINALRFDFTIEEYPETIIAQRLSGLLSIPQLIYFLSDKDHRPNTNLSDKLNSLLHSQMIVAYRTSPTKENTQLLFNYLSNHVWYYSIFKLMRNEKYEFDHATVLTFLRNLSYENVVVLHNLYPNSPAEPAFLEYFSDIFRTAQTHDIEKIMAVFSRILTFPTDPKEQDLKDSKDQLLHNYKGQVIGRIIEFLNQDHPALTQEARIAKVVQAINNLKDFHGVRAQQIHMNLQQFLELMAALDADAWVSLLQHNPDTYFAQMIKIYLATHEGVQKEFAQAVDKVFPANVDDLPAFLKQMSPDSYNVYFQQNKPLEDKHREGRKIIDYAIDESIKARLLATKDLSWLKNHYSVVTLLTVEEIRTSNIDLIPSGRLYFLKESEIPKLNNEELMSLLTCLERFSYWGGERPAAKVALIELSKAERIDSLSDEQCKELLRLVKPGPSLYTQTRGRSIAESAYLNRYGALEGNEYEALQDAILKHPKIVKMGAT